MRLFYKKMYYKPPIPAYKALERILTNGIDIGAYSYYAKTGQKNEYVLFPKSNSFLYRNAFLPKITVSLETANKQDSIRLIFSPMRSIEIGLWIYLGLLTVFSVAFLLTERVSILNNPKLLLIVLLVFAVFYIFVLLGFRSAYWWVHKKIIEVCQDSDSPKNEEIQNVKGMLLLSFLY